MSLVYTNIVTTTMKVQCHPLICISKIAARSFIFNSQWFPGKTGLMASMTLAGFGYGSVIWNPLETLYVNPDNIAPVSVPGEVDK